MATYSQSVTGALADSLPFRVTEYTLPDGFSKPGGEAQAARTGIPLLCKGPDGATGWYVIDAEQSIPGVRRVLKPV